MINIIIDINGKDTIIKMNEMIEDLPQLNNYYSDVLDDIISYEESTSSRKVDMFMAVKNARFLIEVNETHHNNIKNIERLTNVICSKSLLGINVTNGVLLYCDTTNGDIVINLGPAKRKNGTVLIKKNINIKYSNHKRRWCRADRWCIV